MDLLQNILVHWGGYLLQLSEDSLTIHLNYRDPASEISLTRVVTMMVRFHAGDKNYRIIGGMVWQLFCFICKHFAIKSIFSNRLNFCAFTPSCNISQPWAFIQADSILGHFILLCHLPLADSSTYACMCAVAFLLCICTCAYLCMHIFINMRAYLCGCVCACMSVY